MMIDCEKHDVSFNIEESCPVCELEEAQRMGREIIMGSRHKLLKHFQDKSAQLEAELDAMNMNTPEYIERERNLERVVGDMSNDQLFALTLWEIASNTSNTSDVVCAELLKRSGVSEGLAKW